MQTHNWSAQQRVHSGTGALEQALPKELEAFGWRRAMLVTTNSLRDGALVERVRALMGERHAGTLADIPAHSPVEAVARIVAACREAGVDGIVAVGGGSVIDACKAVLLALGAKLDPAALTARRLVEASRLVSSDWGTDFARPRMIVVPTTLSAAEFTAFGGVSDLAVGRKYRVGHPLAVPAVVIQDPSCTLDTPEALLLSTGARAIDHTVEGFCSVRPSAVSDATTVEGARRLFRSLPRIRSAPQDLEARADAQSGAWLSILGSSGGVPHGASHGIGYLLGAGFGVPHGVTSCVMLPAVLRWNMAANAERQRTFAERVGLAPDRALADHVESLFTALGLPTRLSQVGVERKDFERLARAYDGTAPIATNPRPVEGVDEMLEIIELAA